MLDGLDSIPWKQLTHAYGSAEDVPALLRALRMAPPGGNDEESPLWCLFGNIWHQGTVYEATAFAVPFLIELAANPLTPDRVGILDLLAAIAKGTSYRSVHGDTLCESGFEEKQTRELIWVAEAHGAVAAGFRALAAITKENPEIRLAAAHVLAQLPEHANAAGPLLRNLLRNETHRLFRAGLLLLLGQAGDRSEESLSVLTTAMNSGDDAQCLAATLSIAKLKPRPLPLGAREAMIHAITADHLEESFEGLPWDAMGEIDPEDLRACLDAPAQQEAAESLIEHIESDKGTHNRVATLLDLLFPMAKRGPTPPIDARKLSPLQMRAVRALGRAMGGGRRIFFGHLPQWGLPDSRRDWKNLVAGREPTLVDLSLPILADPKNPRREVRPDLLKSGQRVVHRAFGAGTVAQIERTGNSTRVSVEFDEEGTKTLLLP